MIIFRGRVSLVCRRIKTSTHNLFGSSQHNTVPISSRLLRPNHDIKSAATPKHELAGNWSTIQSYLRRTHVSKTQVQKLSFFWNILDYTKSFTLLDACLMVHGLWLKSHGSWLQAYGSWLVALVGRLGHRTTWGPWTMNQEPWAMNHQSVNNVAQISMFYKEDFFQTWVSEA